MGETVLSNQHPFCPGQEPVQLLPSCLSLALQRSQGRRVRGHSDPERGQDSSAALLTKGVKDTELPRCKGGRILKE